MRAITGDIYGYAPVSQDTAGNKSAGVSKVMIVSPKQLDGANFVKALVYGGKIEGIYLSNRCVNDICYLPADNDTEDFNTVKSMSGVIDKNVKIEIKEDDSIYKFVNDKISQIIDDLRNKRALNTDEINFINSMPLPLYKILNLVTTLNLDPSSLEGVKEYLSYRILQSFIDKYFTEINRAVLTISTYPDLQKTYDKEALREWQLNAYKNIKTIKGELNKRIYEAQKRVTILNDLINKFARMETEMKRHSPIWSADAL
jgi:conjugative transfer pilus assembly protein TraH